MQMTNVDLFVNAIDSKTTSVQVILTKNHAGELKTETEAEHPEFHKSQVFLNCYVVKFCVIQHFKINYFDTSCEKRFLYII